MAEAKRNASKLFVQRVIAEGRGQELRKARKAYCELHGLEKSEYSKSFWPVAKAWGFTTAIAEEARITEIEAEQADEIDDSALDEIGDYEDLPECENIAEDVQWVLDNFPLSVNTKGELNESFLAKEAPSRTAVTLMACAAADLGKFMTQFVPKVLKRETDAAEDESVHWKDRPADLNRIRQAITDVSHG